MRGAMLLVSGAIILSLAGCASKGVNADGAFPKTEFEVETDYEAAHRRAIEFLRVCFIDAQHRYGVTYITLADVDLKGTLGTLALAKNNQDNAPLMTIESEPAGTRRAKISVKVLGEEPWDEAQLAAARQSISSATPVCRPE